MRMADSSRQRPRRRVAEAKAATDDDDYEEDSADKKGDDEYCGDIDPDNNKRMMTRIPMQRIYDKHSDDEG